ncbi:MAG: HlyU family transcriptional regulator [Pseudomonadota bacterium]
MSFLKKLFGGGGDSGGGKPAAETTYEGFAITAIPQSDSGQFRLSGTITKEVNGEMKEHRLIRADLFPSADECAEATIRKAKQVIDEQGEKLFL